MLTQLQNGSDIRGVAIETEEKKINLDLDSCRKIAVGFYLWLRGKTGKNSGMKIALGMDSRLSGPDIKKAVTDSLINLGCTVLDCGLSTTPSMYMTTVFDAYSCDGAIMVTASHLPYYYNGLKFFTESGGCESNDIKSILELAECNVDVPSNVGAVVEMPLLNDYSQHLVKIIRDGIASKSDYERPLCGMKIIVDAGNGAGGFFAEKVLEVLGADTSGSQFLEPDGTFPNHVPNPEDKQAMESVTRATVISGSDLGIIFDTDVDRAAIVTGDGEEINRNALIALLSAIVLEENPGATIVTDSVTSTGLTEFIQNLGGVHHRFKRGYRNVIRECIRLNENGINSPMAIETSGHGAMRENYYLDDGSYLIAKLLIKAAKLRRDGKELVSLISNLKEAREASAYRLGINTKGFRIYGETVLNNLNDFVNTVKGWSVEPVNYEGVRVNCDKNAGDGWFLMRLSLHEPLMVINIESDSDGGVNIIKSHLEEFLSVYVLVDKM